MAKHIDQKGITGRQGVNLVERRILSMGHVWNETRMEAGIDGTVEIRDPVTTAMSNHVLLAQVKSGDSYFKSESATEFTFYPDADDLRYWLDGNAPVILIVCRPEKEEAYWVSIRDYFREAAPAKRAKIVFQKATQTFDKNSAEALRHLAAPRAWGLHTPPAPHTETLYANLLPVTKLPAYVYIAPTEVRDYKEIFSVFKEGKVTGFGEFILREGNLISIHDLKADPFKTLCETSAVERFAFTSWAGEYEVWARELLRKMLGELAFPWHLKFNARDDLFYTIATPGGEPRQWPVQGEHKASAITVYKRYPAKADPTRIAYHRHSGFFAQFQLYDERWFLMLSPTYFFTSDGRKRHSKHEEMLKKMKILERQKAVYGQLLMWSQRLLPHTDMFLRPYEHLEFGPLLTFDCPVGIDDAAWKPEVDQAAEDFDGTANLDLAP